MPLDGNEERFVEAGSTINLEAFRELKRVLCEVDRSWRKRLDMNVYFIPWYFLFSQHGCAMGFAMRDRWFRDRGFSHWSADPRRVFGIDHHGVSHLFFDWPNRYPSSTEVIARIDAFLAERGLVA
jgi:hypothetical protein